MWSIGEGSRSSAPLPYPEDYGVSAKIGATPQPRIAVRLRPIISTTVRKLGR